MGQQTSGLSNAEYAEWMANTAADDCALVEELYIRLTSGTQNTYTQTAEICSIMSNATEEQVAGYQEVIFSGTDGDEEPWSAIDERLTTNLERVENNGVVPVKIRRPRGQ